MLDIWCVCSPSQCHLMLLLRLWLREPVMGLAWPGGHRTKVYTPVFGWVSLYVVAFWSDSMTCIGNDSLWLIMDPQWSYYGHGCLWCIGNILVEFNALYLRHVHMRGPDCWACPSSGTLDGQTSKIPVPVMSGITRWCPAAWGKHWSYKTVRHKVNIRDP